MTMTRERFETLIQQLESYAQRQPSSYKLRVGLLAILGYAYILLIGLGLLALIGLLIGLVRYSHHFNVGLIKLLLLLGIPLFITGRSLLEAIFLRFPAPSGLAVTRQQVPQLFQLIDELTSALKCPPCHHVLLTSEYNAGVFQLPRGLLAGQSNYLLIGLPLLQAVSPEQFRAILAHEFGHLSGNHSQFNNWIYRLRKTWMQILERMQQSSNGGTSLLFSRFFDWYAPFFNAYSFVLARTDEYEADRCAATLVGSQHIAAALVTTDIKARFLETNFWTKINQQVKEDPDPPAKLFTQMGETLQTAIATTTAQEWIEQALATKTNLHDTHPCLRDRLQSLGFTPEQALPLLTPLRQSAADSFLGASLTTLTQQLNQEWQTSTTFQWRERYSQTQQSLQQLQSLEHKSSQMPLTLEEAWEQAKLTSELVGHTEAIPLFRAILRRDEKHISANYWLGQILLQQHDESGIKYLETAIAQDPNLVIEACESIAHFLQQKGQTSAAQSYRQRADRHYENLLLAQKERADANERDRFQSHHLTLAESKALRQQLSQYPEIKEAYLVEKVVQYFPEIPFYVLGVKRNSHRLGFDGNSKDKALIDRLAHELHCPGNTWIVILNRANQKLEKSLKKAAIEPLLKT